MYKNNQMKIKLHMLLIGLVLIGAVNWGTTALGYNLVEILSTTVNKTFKLNIPINNIIYIVVALAAIKLAVDKTTWLPFLGVNVLPSNLIPLTKPPNDTNKKINIKTLPNKKIVYWASLPSIKSESPTGLPDVESAYADYSNSGVIMSNDKGEATIEIKVGSDYIVPSGRVISRHVHYRVLGLPYGMIGEIKTEYY